MSVNNTIKLTSVEGEKYIQPQNTLVYKGITLFGYGYLDWGTIVNQSIIDLMDAIDALQDSGLSEIKFDLTEYEETQKRLRAEEFSTWKSGFKELLQNLVGTYIDESKKMITDFTTTQTKINTDTTKLIQENFNTLDQEIKDVGAGLDELVQTLIQEQVQTLVKSVNNLSGLVQSATASLSEATDNANKVLTEVQQLISNFKTEFNKTFITFKDETTNALQTNKEYLIKYIDSLINKSNIVSEGLDERLTSLELLSDALNPESVRDIIISKVNEITAGIVTSYLSDYEKRLTQLDTDIKAINTGMDLIIQKKIDSAMSTITGQIESFSTSLVNLSKLVNGIVQDVSPLTQMRKDILTEFTDIPTFVETILNINTLAENTLILTEAGAKSSTSVAKNIVEVLLNQEVRNNERMISVIDSNLLNLVDGLGNSSFDELSLIKRIDAKKNLFSNLTGAVATDIKTYGDNNLRLSYLEIDQPNNRMHTAIRLPVSRNLLWAAYGVRFTIVETGSIVDGVFEVTGSSITLQSQTLVKGLKMDIVYDTNDLKPFTYSYDHNSSSNLTLHFPDTYSYDHHLKVELWDASTDYNYDASRVLASINSIPIGYGSWKENDDTFRNDIYPLLYATNHNIDKPTSSAQAIVWDNPTDYVLVPVCNIQTKPDATKELNLKVKLPKTATLTKIVFSDGFGSFTKNFTNGKFPLDEAEYTARSLATTNNYYTDICSTGIVRFPVNSATKKVTGTITYLIGGVTKTFDITSTGTGSGSETKVMSAVIGSGAFAEYNVTTLFGAGIDSNTITVETRVQETNTSSDIFGKYIKGDNLCSVVWIDSQIIRIYNEYSTSLTFQFAFKN